MVLGLLVLARVQRAWPVLPYCCIEFICWVLSVVAVTLGNREDFLCFVLHRRSRLRSSQRSHRVYHPLPLLDQARLSLVAEALWLVGMGLTSSVGCFPILAGLTSCLLGHRCLATASVPGK